MRNEGCYTYSCLIALVDTPFTETQHGEDGIDRQVWMFPIPQVPDNDVKKPGMFVFKDWEDYQKNGKNVDAKYNASHGVKAGRAKKVERIRHKKFGEGVVIEKKGGFLIVQFSKVGRKQLNEKVCLDKGLIGVV